MQDTTQKDNVKSQSMTMFWLSIISFFISSATILLMQLGSFEPDGNVLLAYILAGTFWLFLILGVVFFLILNRQRKRTVKFARVNGIGLLRFFQNIPAGIFDILLIIGVASLIISLNFIRTLPDILTLIATFITVFSLEMHCMLNGKNYKWLFM